MDEQHQNTANGPSKKRRLSNAVASRSQGQGESSKAERAAPSPQLVQWLTQRGWRKLYDDNWGCVVVALHPPTSVFDALLFDTTTLYPALTDQGMILRYSPVNVMGMPRRFGHFRHRTKDRQTNLWRRLVYNVVFPKGHASCQPNAAAGGSYGPRRIIGYVQEVLHLAMGSRTRWRKLVPVAIKDPGHPKKRAREQREPITVRRYQSQPYPH
jgi:hypothetical protein